MGGRRGCVEKEAAVGLSEPSVVTLRMSCERGSAGGGSDRPALPGRRGLQALVESQASDWDGREASRAGSPPPLPASVHAVPALVQGLQLLLLRSGRSLWDQRPRRDSPPFRHFRAYSTAKG